MTRVKNEGRPRGRPRSAEARKAILEATRRELDVVGYEGLSIQHVASVAGVGKQTIYRSWPTKQELVAACVLEGLVLPESVALATSDDLVADVRAWSRQFAHDYGRGAGAGLVRALVSAAAQNDEIAHALTERFAAPFRAAIAARLSLEHALPARELELVAEALVGTLVLRLLGREPVEPDAMVRLAEGLIAGLAHRAAKRG